MAGHDDSGTSEKKSNNANDIPAFNAENMQNNMKVIYYRFVFRLINLIVQCSKL